MPSRYAPSDGSVRNASSMEACAALVERSSTCQVEMDKLAHAWFGIPKDIASYTRPGLDAVRKVLGVLCACNGSSGLADTIACAMRRCLCETRIR